MQWRVGTNCTTETPVQMLQIQLKSDTSLIRTLSSVLKGVEWSIISLGPRPPNLKEGREFFAVQWPGIEAKWSLVVIASLGILQDLEGVSENMT